MPKIREVLEALETIAPSRFAFSFDKVGLQVGDPNATVERALVSLDRSLAAVAYTQEIGAQLLLAHHPLIFAPLAKVDTSRHDSRTVLELAKSGISFIAAHTNWDSALGGVNDALAERLGLVNVKPFGTAAEVERFKLVTFTPASHAEAIADAVAAVGAGEIGGYTRCAFHSHGQGCFIRPGQTEPEIVEEIRLEMVVPGHLQRAAVRAMLSVHPYEVPAYDLVALTSLFEQPAGRVGDLQVEVSFADFADLADGYLDTRSISWGDPEKRIRRVAVVGGAADGEWIAAQRAKADVLLTGEVKQHIAVEATESGLCMVASGHYATEQPGVEALRDRMESVMPSVEWELFTPPRGIGGRPIW